MQEILQAIATIIALVNPAMCAKIFTSSVGSVSKKQRILNAFKATVVICIVLMTSAAFGTQILSIFGISLDAFSFAGGGILCFIGIKMMASANDITATDDVQSDATEVSLTQLILFAASPGTITGVITISSSQSGEVYPTILAVVAVSLLLLLILILASFLPVKLGKPSLFRQMVTSYLGVIVIAMGVQFAFTGIKHFMFT